MLKKFAQLLYIYIYTFVALVKFPDNKKYQHKQLLAKRKIN